MKVYGYLSAASPYQKDDQVTGVVFEINQGQGAFVAVDQKYYGLIPKNELFGEEMCIRDSYWSYSSSWWFSRIFPDKAA